MTEPTVSLGQCGERERLVNSISAVMEYLIALHTQEIEVLKSWDLDAMERIDYDLDKASARRDSLLAELKKHIKAHGCHFEMASA